MNCPQRRRNTRKKWRPACHCPRRRPEPHRRGARAGVSCRRTPRPGPPCCASLVRASRSPSPSRARRCPRSNSMPAAPAIARQRGAVRGPSGRSAKTPMRSPVAPSQEATRSARRYVSSSLSAIPVAPAVSAGKPSLLAPLRVRQGRRGVGNCGARRRARPDGGSWDWASRRRHRIPQTVMGRPRSGTGLAPGAGAAPGRGDPGLGFRDRMRCSE